MGPTCELKSNALCCLGEASSAVWAPPFHLTPYLSSNHENTACSQKKVSFKQRLANLIVLLEMPQYRRRRDELMTCILIPGSCRQQQQECERRRVPSSQTLFSCFTLVFTQQLLQPTNDLFLCLCIPMIRCTLLYKLFTHDYFRVSSRYITIFTADASTVIGSITNRLPEKTNQVRERILDRSMSARPRSTDVSMMHEWVQ